MKPSVTCLFLTFLVTAILLSVVMLVKKVATHIQKTEKKLTERPLRSSLVRLSRGMGVIPLSASASPAAALRFPFVGAVTHNSSAPWTFVCFASVILVKWIVTGAHCRVAGASNRFLLYGDVAGNRSHMYKIRLWRVHENFSATNLIPKYNIAVAKLCLDSYPLTVASARFDQLPAAPGGLQASVWMAVTTMDRKAYLTNHLEEFAITVVPPSRCYESYGVFVDDSMICVDMSPYKECFVDDYGPLFEKDKVVGVLALRPRDCDLKLAIFTNVSHYTDWILNTTKTIWFG